MRLIYSRFILLQDYDTYVFAADDVRTRYRPEYRGRRRYTAVNPRHRIGRPRLGDYVKISHALSVFVSTFYGKKNRASGADAVRRRGYPYAFYPEATVYFLMQLPSRWCFPHLRGRIQVSFLL